MTCTWLLVGHNGNGLQAFQSQPQVVFRRGGKFFSLHGHWKWTKNVASMQASVKQPWGCHVLPCPQQGHPPRVSCGPQPQSTNFGPALPAGPKTCLRICIMHMHVFVNTYMRMCVCMYVSVYVYAYICVCIFVDIYICTYICVRVCM